MKIKIRNNTHWSTRDLRRFITRCAKQEGIKTAYMTIVYNRCIDVWVSGNASCPGWNVKIKLPSYSVDQIDLAHTIAHEFAHNRGVTHRQMTGDPYYRRVGRWREIYAWAQDLPLTKISPKAKARPSVDAKLAHAQAMLARATSRIKRASTILRKWKLKVRYYERAALAKGTKSGS